jgi:Domain of unknown function (DUF1707)/Cell wall-active antibiotics response 4TMS YvqF
MSDPGSSALPSPDRAGPLPALRASDIERERAADQLRDAAGDGRLTVEELDERLARCYAAKTVAELAELTVDVPVSGWAPAPGSARTPGAVVRPGPGGSSTIISILSGSDRSGHWRVAPRLKVISVLGGSDIDLTEAEFAAPVTEITVFSLMGGADIRVPDGVEVQISKFALMGGHDVKLSDQPPPPGAPVIHLRMLSIMGGGDVNQGRKLTKAERRLKKSRERGELDGG